MLGAKRRDHILQSVLVEGALKVSDLARELNVSDITIRRDISQLSRQGLVRKVHGGVINAHHYLSSHEPPFLETRDIQLGAKTAIAQHAATLVTPGQSVALLGGSTIFALAKALLPLGSLSIVTNSVPVSDLFAQHTGHHHSIILTGGSRTPTDSLVGPVAVDTFRGFNVDIAFMGSFGVDPKKGFSTPNPLEADVNKAVIAQTHTVCVLADHTKWGVRGLATFADFSDVHHLVTDSDVDLTWRKEVKNLVPLTVVASEETQTT